MENNVQTFEERLRHIIGLADACELLSATFAFPAPSFAEALTQGTYAADATSCLIDAGVEPSRVDAVVGELASFETREAKEVLDALKKGNSILYLAPGLDVPVWPYEAAFSLLRINPKGKPSLFRTRISLDMEQLMRDAGVEAKASRTEPIDSIWNELSYLSFLYGNVAKAMLDGGGNECETWREHIRLFVEGHVKNWFEDFFKASISEASKHSFGREYAVFSRLGLLMLEQLLADNSPEGEGVLSCQDQRGKE